jgi:hypothetical protein
LSSPQGKISGSGSRNKISKGARQKLMQLECEERVFRPSIKCDRIPAETLKEESLKC